MKLKDLKHNHSLTDLLKVLIFSILMLLPFIAVGTRCLYVICNKNAYQSYYGQTINEETINNKNQLSDLIVNDYYYLTTAKPNENNIEIGFASNKIYFDEVNVLTNTSQLDLNNSRSIGFYQSGSYILYYFYDENNNQIGTINSNDYVATLFFKYVSNNLPTTNNILTNSNAVYTISYNSYSYLDNVFDYSVNKLENSELFTWTQNTAIYTGVHAMTTGLSIQGTAIPMLITYWFLLTVIYVIIDIVIKVFTYLTHLIGNKSTE